MAEILALLAALPQLLTTIAQVAAAIQQAYPASTTVQTKTAATLAAVQGIAAVDSTALPALTTLVSAFTTAFHNNPPPAPVPAVKTTA